MLANRWRMTLLLDTHVALWAITGDATVGTEFLDRLRHEPGGLSQATRTTIAEVGTSANRFGMETYWHDH
ncbi:PIN domain nuclease of toxin-antitoxin system [Micromonospora ureilytica]|uniref:PIN domain nuclease of toxin-antitoxin system n=1 Tax=Micromonospora ureilytica TaxID=709868 RepID=A0ABS0J9N6_9ACTN|nr:PIN domain nuclease of toxin-antitoxin system [Micromonospora ureilytica]